MNYTHFLDCDISTERLPSLSRNPAYGDWSFVSDDDPFDRIDREDLREALAQRDLCDEYELEAIHHDASLKSFHEWLEE